MQITSWQGDGLVVDDLERTGEGAYRTTEPIPVHGTWKALLRVHDGRVLTAVPIYLPADEALGEDEIPAEDGMTRSAVPEIEILQRELQDTGGGVWTVANLVVLACTLAFVAAMGWGVGRYARRVGVREPFPTPRPIRPSTTGRRRSSAVADVRPTAGADLRRDHPGGVRGGAARRRHRAAHPVTR